MFTNKLNELDKEQKDRESKLAEKCAAEIMRLTNIIINLQYRKYLN